MFGGRGISAYKLDPRNNSMTLAWDSGDIIEREVSKFFPKIFNGMSFFGNPRLVGPKASMDMVSGERVRKQSLSFNNLYSKSTTSKVVTKKLITLHKSLVDSNKLVGRNNHTCPVLFLFKSNSKLH